MKLVTAVLAPDKLDAVAEALAAVEVFRMTATECRGVVREDSDSSRDSSGGSSRAPFLAEKIRLEIAVNEGFLRPTLDALRTAGSLSDEEGSGFGKIFVSDLLDVVRIRTGERGPDAI